MRTPTLLVALLTACTAPPAGQPARDSGDTGPPPDAQEPEALGSLDALMAADRRSFRPEPDAAVAELPAAGVSVVADQAGVRLDRPDAASALVLVADGLGRGGAVSPLDPVAPHAAACAQPRLEAVEGDCVRRATYAHDGVDAWWQARSDGIQQGWTVYEAPRGDGPVVLTTWLDGASGLERVGDGARFVDATGEGWRVSGPQAWDATGAPLPAALDVAGDRIEVLVDDTGAAYPLTIDPVYTTEALTLAGASGSGSLFGRSLQGGGDVNGDGYMDVVVGEPNWNGGTGRAYVFLGTASGTFPTIHAILAGSSTVDNLGQDVAFLDANGDGYSDVAVGAPAPDSSSGYGKFRVYHGGASGLNTTVQTQVTNASIDDMFGHSLAGADVNGDGYDDLVVGMPGYASDIGRAEVYHGSASGITTTIRTQVTSGCLRNCYMGDSVSNAGDINGDGYEDVVIGIYGEARAHVYLGTSSGMSGTIHRNLTQSGVRFGAGTGGDCDVNGDGYDDVIVGGRTGGGGAWVYHGSAAGLVATAATSLGPVGGSFGDEVACAGDVNGDGYDDVIVGNQNYSSRTGAAYVFHGSASGASGTPDATLTTASRDALGSDVSGAGDVDGDGYDDVWVGKETAGTSSDGRVSLYRGYATDSDGDGIPAYDDCDDSDSSVGAASTWYPDSDGDGYGVSTGSTESCTQPSGTAAVDGDCDDGDGTVNPDATETIADGVDSDCDGAETCYVDADDDGHRLTATVASADDDCADAGEALASEPTGDCDDGDGTVNPGATDTIADGVDSDCDGAETCYVDADDDGWRLTATVASADDDCTDAGEALAAEPTLDCDDGDGTVNPGATDTIADGVDSDCDGAETCYVDADDDGYRLTATVASADDDCTDAGEALASEPTLDCDDTSSSVFPGASEVVGDEIDQDCDGSETCYADADSDGYRPDATSTVASSDADCDDAGEAESTDPTGDCDDTDSAIRPGLSDTPGDEVDTDCDGTETCYVDNDGDGYRPDATSTVVSADDDCSDVGEAVAADPTGDCDDADPGISPAATELAGDEVDQDCDGAETCYADADDDGYRPDATSTVASSDTDCADTGEATDAAPTGDCDDTDATISPAAAEVAGDEVDQDCDGAETCFVDADDDGYRPDATSTVPSGDLDCTDAGEALDTDPTGDCDDTDAAFRPDATEDCADPTDYNCDGSVGYADADDDGWAACEECDDSDAAVNPDATEVPGDGVDQDCDASELCFEDTDEDGFRDVAAATVASADLTCAEAGLADASAPATDCDDSDAAVNPDADEVCNDTDDDCDGTVDGPDSIDATPWYPDADADGFTLPSDSVDDCAPPDGYAALSDAADCDDDNALINPGATDTPDDGVDQDCDGEDATTAGDDTGGGGDGGDDGDGVTDGGDDKGDGSGCSTTGRTPLAPALPLLAALLVPVARRRRSR